MEITSKATAHNDRTTKVEGYAEAGVPLYLLVDLQASDGPTITLHRVPKDGSYRVLSTGRFGDPVTLPEPFDLTLAGREFRSD